MGFIQRIAHPVTGSWNDEQPFRCGTGFEVFISHFDWHKIIIRPVDEQHRDFAVCHGISAGIVL